MERPASFTRCGSFQYGTNINLFVLSHRIYIFDTGNEATVLHLREKPDNCGYFSNEVAAFIIIRRLSRVVLEVVEGLYGVIQIIFAEHILIRKALFNDLEVGSETIQPLSQSSI